MLEKFWKIGEKGKNYFKFKIFEINFPFFLDCFLLKLLPDQYIPPHVDEIPEKFKNKYTILKRLNIFIRLPKQGGYYIISRNNKEKYIFDRFNITISNIETHSVTKILEGSMIILTIGWLSNKK